MSTDATVFVVDHEADARKSLQWLLESKGFHVETRASAREFLDRYGSEGPGCLVLEVHMPGMDGLELQDELVSRGKIVPIVFLTETGDIPSCVRAMRAGAIGFLEKPVRHDSLLPLLRRALEEDRLRRERESVVASIESRLKQLTRREWDVMELLWAGKSIKVIARELDISFQTVSKHRCRLLKKMDAQSDVELIRALLACRLQRPGGSASDAEAWWIQEPHKLGSAHSPIRLLRGPHWNLLNCSRTQPAFAGDADRF